MTAERLFLEIGNVDEKYFTRAMKYRSPWVKRRPVKGLLAAAVLIFLLTVGISVSAETILYYRAVDYLTEMNIDISQMTRSEIKERYREEIAKDPHIFTDYIHGDYAAGELSRGFNRVGKAAENIAFDNKAVNDYFDCVLFIFIKLDFL